MSKNSLQNELGHLFCFFLGREQLFWTVEQIVLLAMRRLYWHLA